MRKTITAAALTGALLVLAGCGNDSNEASGDSHNDADVTFAQQMIPHHEQAIEMAQMAATQAQSDEVKELAADIEAAQGPEIELLTGWLEDWDEEVPDGMSGMDGDMGHDMSDMGDESAAGMSGMMTAEDMAALEGASGTEFDQMFLTMMIEHHQGAIEMAQTEQTEGEYAEAISLAEDIEATQSEEIAAMQDLLSS